MMTLKHLLFVLFITSFLSNTSWKGEAVTINLPVPGNKTTRAIGISNLKISTTISTTGVSYCMWRYGGMLDGSAFHHILAGCHNIIGENETITCVKNASTLTSQLTMLQPQYKDLNINMQCSPSPSYSVNIVYKNCIATNEVIVISNKSEYNSVGSINCPSGSELFYKVNGSLAVDRTTTCNAYAEWTNINNMLCSNGPIMTSIIGNHTVQAGSRAYLKCIHSGELPTVNFSRFYFDQKTREVTKSSWESPPLQASDNNKVVECQAVNQYTNYFNQSHRANITLNVTYPPMFYFKSLICTWRVNQLGTCSVTFKSNPPAIQIKLEKNGQLAKGQFNQLQNIEEQVFVFSKNNPSANDSGKYKVMIITQSFQPVYYNFTIKVMGVVSMSHAPSNAAAVAAYVEGSIIIVLMVIIAVLIRKPQMLKLAHQNKERKDLASGVSATRRATQNNAAARNSNSDNNSGEYENYEQQQPQSGGGYVDVDPAMSTVYEDINYR